MKYKPDYRNGTYFVCLYLRGMEPDVSLHSSEEGAKQAALMVIASECANWGRDPRNIQDDWIDEWHDITNHSESLYVFQCLINNLQEN